MKQMKKQKQFKQTKSPQLNGARIKVIVIDECQEIDVFEYLNTVRSLAWCKMANEELMEELLRGIDRADFKDGLLNVWITKEKTSVNEVIDIAVAEINKEFQSKKMKVKCWANKLKDDLYLSVANFQKVEVHELSNCLTKISGQKVTFSFKIKV